jgi:hypothetical protein|tara:strand:- start:2553 stop:3080 length:528 start_codon:yes stop_codon:yes gene_type:complete
MERKYKDGTKKDITFFIGTEIEKTPAYGLKTLFVVGLQSIENVKEHLHADISHIFFGANHSFDPASQSHDADYYREWDSMIMYFLEKGYKCSLDIPLNAAEDFLESTCVEFNNFIPQIRVPIPYIEQWNYNTMLKIDDKGFNKSNPGIWTHSLHDLMDRKKFTDWKDYGLDKVLK